MIKKIILGILIVSGVSIWFFYSNPSDSVPAGFEKYSSSTFGFSLIHPEEMVIEEFEEGGGAKTILFHNNVENFSFQIFVLPYKEEVITEERFSADIPSGVRENLGKRVVDKVSATTFYSNSLGFGDTFEIWFIKSGWLYEVTTSRSLENKLNEIIDTWEFI